MESARSAVEKAELNLERTNIRAPFNAVVLEESIELGQQVGPSGVAATLVGTDAFRIETLVPQDELRWVAIPGINSSEGSKVKVILDHGEWDAVVTGLMSSVAAQGRMARILVQVPDPFNLAKSGRLKGVPLLINSYVKLEIEGLRAEGVFVLPQGALHAGKIWVLGSENRLSIRPVTLVRGQADEVLVRGDLKDGELVITSRIPAPVEGMQLKRLMDNGETDGDDQQATATNETGPASKGNR